MNVKKFFPADKNYLLKEAQVALEERLRDQLIDLIKELYFAQFNPLGLEDDFIRTLKKASVKDDKFLEKPYEILAALYRYQFGDNQLELLWDGTSHVDHYKNKWQGKYSEWLIEMCLKKPAFTRALIKSIFNADQQMNMEFIERYLSSAILEHFGFKLYKKQGLVATSA